MTDIQLSKINGAVVRELEINVSWNGDEGLATRPEECDHSWPKKENWASSLPMPSSQRCSIANFRICALTEPTYFERDGTVQEKPRIPTRDCLAIQVLALEMPQRVEDHLRGHRLLDEYNAGVFDDIVQEIQLSEEKLGELTEILSPDEARVTVSPLSRDPNWKKEPISSLLKLAA